MITVGKQNGELLAKIIPPVDLQIGELQQNVITVEDNGNLYSLTVEFSSINE